MKFDHLKDLPKAESLLAMEILWQSLSQNPSEDLTPLAPTGACRTIGTPEVWPGKLPALGSSQRAPAHPDPPNPKPLSQASHEWLRERQSL